MQMDENLGRCKGAGGRNATFSECGSGEAVKQAAGSCKAGAGKPQSRRRKRTYDQKAGGTTGQWPKRTVADSARGKSSVTGGTYVITK